MGLSDLFIDVALLPNDGYGFFQLISLGCIYGYILFYASNMISDGSELLLLVPSMAGLVGASLVESNWLERRRTIIFTKFNANKSALSYENYMRDSTTLFDVTVRTINYPPANCMHLITQQFDLIHSIRYKQPID